MVVQSIDAQLSTHDAQLIKNEQLGAPLGMYRLKSGYLNFVRGIGIFPNRPGLPLSLLISTAAAISR